MVVIKTVINAIAIPKDMDPCSNSRTINVDITSLFGGEINDAVTSSLKPIIKVIIHAEKTDFNIRGKFIFLKIYRGLAPKTFPAATKFSEICVYPLVT